MLYPAFPGAGTNGPVGLHEAYPSWASVSCAKMVVGWENQKRTGKDSCSSQTGPLLGVDSLGLHRQSSEAGSLESAWTSPEAGSREAKS